MYRSLRTIRLRETDATGVLYFAEQLKLALEAFEAFLSEKKFHLMDLIRQGEFLLPVVHVEANYMHPLRVGDEVEMRLEVEKVGSSSFTLKTIFYLKEMLVGDVRIVHVATSSETGRSIVLPQVLVDLLVELQI
jgi:1,4-dihydroxy-2-naphthoyl-CoA hydrolase